MKKMPIIFLFLVPCLALVTALSSCGSDEGTKTVAPGTVLTDEDVTVGAGGGSGEVSFSTDSVYTVRITLTAESSMQPYGYLTDPNGEGEYTPGDGAAQGGVNTSDVSLDPAGEYALTVYDGTNQGGKVKVHVEVL